MTELQLARMLFEDGRTKDRQVWIRVGSEERPIELVDVHVLPKREDIFSGKPERVVIHAGPSKDWRVVSIIGLVVAVAVALLLTFR